jgi:hypothetical protein
MPSERHAGRQSHQDSRLEQGHLAKGLENRHDEKALEFATNKDSLEKLYLADKQDYDEQSMEYAKQYGALVVSEVQKIRVTPELKFLEPDKFKRHGVLMNDSEERNQTPLLWSRS